MVCGVETEAYGGYCVALRWPLFMAIRFDPLRVKIVVAAMSDHCKAFH